MKNFWNKVYDELGFIFVSGVPDNSFKDLINAMDSDLMHFVPAVDEQAALGLATGAYMAGLKSLVMINSKRFSNIEYQFTKLNVKENLPLIILTDDASEFKGLKQFKVDDLWTDINNYVYGKLTSVVVSLN